MLERDRGGVFLFILSSQVFGPAITSSITRLVETTIGRFFLAPPWAWARTLHLIRTGRRCLSMGHPPRLARSPQERLPPRGPPIPMRLVLENNGGLSVCFSFDFVSKNRLDRELT